MNGGCHPGTDGGARRDGGYILASVIGVLLAISLVAAALVGASGEAASRLRRAEDQTARQAVLESAILVLTTQLAVDPRRRVLDLETASSLDILDQSVKFRIAWESSKLDINRAESSVIERRLAAAAISGDLRAAVATRIARARADQQPISLLNVIASEKAAQDCLGSVLTVFGGVESFDASNQDDDAPIGRPAVGSKIALDVAIAGHEADGLSVVVLLTGDNVAPWQVLDWRQSSVLAQEACDDIQA